MPHFIRVDLQRRASKNAGVKWQREDAKAGGAGLAKLGQPSLDCGWSATQTNEPSLLAEQPSVSMGPQQPYTQLPQQKPASLAKVKEFTIKKRIIGDSPQANDFAMEHQNSHLSNQHPLLSRMSLLSQEGGPSEESLTARKKRNSAQMMLLDEPRPADLVDSSV